MMDEEFMQSATKPLAGACPHNWEAQATPYAVAQVCALCKLFRYKASATADWEYRAPIPIAGARQA